MQTYFTSANSVAMEDNVADKAAKEVHDNKAPEERATRLAILEEKQRKETIQVVAAKQAPKEKTGWVKAAR